MAQGGRRLRRLEGVLRMRCAGDLPRVAVAFGSLDPRLSTCGLAARALAAIHRSRSNFDGTGRDVAFGDSRRFEDALRGGMSMWLAHAGPWGAAFAAPPATIVRPDGRRGAAAGDLKTLLSGSWPRFEQACHPSPSGTPGWTHGGRRPSRGPVGSRILGSAASDPAPLFDSPVETTNGSGCGSGPGVGECAVPGIASGADGAEDSGRRARDDRSAGREKTGV
jgi:hypothetical protein